MSDTLRRLIAKRNNGICCGIASYCTANELVIEACLHQAQRFDDDVLIEATANQVNQFGGYTGMDPAGFRDFVYEIADRISFPREKIILGGDHLGPLVWSEENEDCAMEKAAELVKLFVKAGFKKIHLDTSMRLGGDSAKRPLAKETIARRGAYLYRECERAYDELLLKNPTELHPAFVIGSEVPVPGGTQETENSVSVTSVEEFESTISAYREAFSHERMENAFTNIIGVVVQPGVEFGDNSVQRYDRNAAQALTVAAKKMECIVLEGHSTDYQPAAALREMVEDGVAILKVGPALTFALREGLFALSLIEKQFFPEKIQAHFIETLEQVMLNDSKYWKKYYTGDSKLVALKRKFSYSDRCRYYLAEPHVVEAMERLFENMSNVHIPLSMLHQFMPLQYCKVRDGKLSNSPRELVKDFVVYTIEDYNFATHHNYMIANTFFN